MKTSSIRVGVYCRVSTKDQTADNQILDLRKYCKARGWQIIAECVDHGISGSKDDRPQLKTVMDLARKRKIDALLVWRFDRFARSLTHLVNTLEELRRLGVDFVSYQESVDTSTAQGRMVFGVMASLAEFERVLIQDRIHSGLRRALTQGKKLGRPKVSVDHAKVDQLRREGLSVRKIASTLGLGKSTIASLLSEKPLRNLAKGLVGVAV